MENSAFNVRKKTKFDLLTAIVTSLDVVLVLVATSLLTLTFFHVFSAEHKTEKEISTLLHTDLPVGIYENDHKDISISEIQNKFPYSTESP